MKNLTEWIEGLNLKERATFYTFFCAYLGSRMEDADAEDRDFIRLKEIHKGAKAAYEFTKK
ncbi:hypothetical protein [Virgibacillus sediminis]|uniref:Uncharacterized protein n=1 Tax=Virgibacillus sediminis TaxID=202260 RepID=A0ABV7A6W3_9BACI